MIELTEEQRKLVQHGRAVRVRENGQEYVLLRTDVYDRLAEAAYDDSSWESQEIDLLRKESVAMLDRFGKDK